MKIKPAIFMVLVVIIVLVGCFERPPEEDSTGNLEFQILTWNSYESNMNKTVIDTYTCPIVDIRHLIPLIEFTKDTIYHEGPADQEWIVFYESNREMLNTERDMSGVLDTGTYRGMRLFQRNLMYWICTRPDDIYDTLEFADWNYQDTNEVGLYDTLYNIFGSDGLYSEHEDQLFNVNYTSESGNNEQIGCYFKILPGRTTRVTVRMNLYTLDWIDKNEDGIYTFLDTTKDRLDNWTTYADSIITMSDFIVEYLE